MNSLIIIDERIIIFSRENHGKNLISAKMSM